MTSRQTPPVPRLSLIDTSTKQGQLQFAALIERFLRSLLDSVAQLNTATSVSAKFSGLSPKPIGATSNASPGTAAAGYLAGDSQGTVVTGSPTNPTGQNAAGGSGNALLRADCIVKQGIVTQKGDVLGFDSLPNRIPVGADTQVLTADSTQALGVKWAPNAAVAQYWPGLMGFGV